MSIKSVFIGGPGVGKTSIIRSYVEGDSDQSTRPTISAQFAQKHIKYNDKEFDFGIWDTAGAEQYRSIAPMYFRGAVIAFVVSDASNPQTDEDARFWISELQSKAEPNVKIVIVMNKIDLVTDMNEIEERAKNLSKDYSGYYCMTSTVTRTGIDEMFQYVFGLIEDQIQEEPEEVPSVAPVVIKSTPPAYQTRQKDKCC